MSWPDGRKYTGDWKHGKQHGKGKYIKPDGTERVGEWQNGKKIKWIDETKTKQL
jgi:hypothetical protein